MAKIKSEWTNALTGFDNEVEVFEFIWERANFKDLHDSYTLAGNVHEAGQCFSFTAKDKKSVLYDFMIEVFEEKDRLQKENSELRLKIEEKDKMSKLCCENDLISKKALLKEFDDSFTDWEIGQIIHCIECQPLIQHKNQHVNLEMRKKK